LLLLLGAIRGWQRKKKGNIVMSALAQPVFIPARHLTELEATRQIGREASAANDRRALAGIVATALTIRGVQAVRIEIKREALAWGANLDGRPHGSAVAEIAASGQSWGDLRLSFELHDSSLDSPLRFAKFLAQQIAGILSRETLLHQRELLRVQIARLRDIVAKRKAIQRARAIVANSRKVTERDALILMCKLSRESKRTLHEVAEAFIFGEAKKWASRSAFRGGYAGAISRSAVGIARSA
jgi:ANTAR domain